MAIDLDAPPGEGDRLPSGMTGYIANTDPTCFDFLRSLPPQEVVINSLGIFQGVEDIPIRDGHRAHLRQFPGRDY